MSGIKIKYEKKYVAFLDVLGFSELVYSNKRVEKLEPYFEAISFAFKEFDITKAGMEKRLISDSIIIAVDDNKDALRMLLTAVRRIQSGLAMIDVWLRGAISYGDIYFRKDPDIVVGTGLINAYQLEKEAKFPRVIIDPFILSRLNLTSEGFYLTFNENIQESIKSKKLIHNYGAPKQYRLTQDDAIFVCYASHIVSIALKEVNNVDKHDYLNLIYNNIRSNLYKTQKHYPKYQWLKKYFLETIINYREYWGADPKYAKLLFDAWQKFQKL